LTAVLVLWTVPTVSSLLDEDEFRIWPHDLYGQVMVLTGFVLLVKAVTVRNRTRKLAEVRGKSQAHPTLDGSDPSQYEKPSRPLIIRILVRLLDGL
jgi:hypothetical protein